MKNLRFASGLPDAVPVTVEVFDLKGHRVRRESYRRLGPGWHTLDLNARDHTDQLLPSGVYFYRVTTPDQSAVRKIVITR